MAKARKRVYKSVTVVPGPEGHELRLDERPLRTPAKALLAVPGGALAEAIAEEWRSQGDTVEPASMPLTALACSAIDLVQGRRTEVIDELTDFAAHELLCYRVPH